MRQYVNIFIAAASLLLMSGVDKSSGQTFHTDRILILFEGNDNLSNYARGDARQLAMLLGHFKVEFKIHGVETYSPGEINNYDLTFFIGYSKKCDPPEKFMREVYQTQKRIVWMNTGMERFAGQYDLVQRYGFSFVRLDTVSNFDIVKASNRTFTKGEPNLNILQLEGRGKVEVLATAYSSAARREFPYIIRSGNFMYIADSPFASATETDRYIYFADMLHDLIGEQHGTIHRALIRIEDVDLFENPSKLRDIADLLYSKNVPFLVGIIPFFVDRQADIHISLSDKPEFVDAIHYMVAHGATIVMHGVTHQYQGVTGTDYEFWDGSMNRKIKNDSREYVEKKIKMGLEECWKNNIYPLVWETPHYTASQLDYPFFSEFFSTAMEQRMVIDDPDYSQYFPYIIEHDLYGQRIIPENLGYIPLDEDPKVETEAVQRLLKGAESQLAVRDGFASAFIHAFIDLEYMEQYVDGILEMGYTFMDVKNEACSVRLKERVILTGDQAYEVTLEDQYLRQTWLKPNGDVERQEISSDRIKGKTGGKVQVGVGEIFLAEPSEFRETELTWFEKLRARAGAFWDNLLQGEETYDEARVAILWDTHLKGSGMNDQASFAAVFRSLNIDVDTLVGDSVANLGAYNLLVVPYTAVEHFSNRDYDRVVQFVEDGGCLITDGKNGLAEELGIKFAASTIKIERMRDRLYPEDPIVPSHPDIMTRFEVEKADEYFCLDEKTDAPVVIGRHCGDGKFLFFGMRFDPVSSGGYSRFPYIMEYVRHFFRLRPVLRRENLEIYFDDGYRHNVSIEDLVKRWGSDGVRVVHVVGWHQYQTWTYNYGRLIDLCHANGILVYAWLDPPQVSEKFWKDHPEWRELNYKGEAVRPSWRYPVALTDTGCLASVKTTFRDFLLKYDWDGVNLAELYFEAGNGPQDARLFTPFHPSVRQEFKRSSGFDPVLLFDQFSDYYWKTNPAALKRFEDYRVETLKRLHEEFLKLMAEIRSSKPHFDVVVTAMDNLGNPELRLNNGVDIVGIIGLSRKYPFTLQVEDPQTEWSKDPRRYRHMAKRYQALTGGSPKLMVDLNILAFRDEKKPTPFPTLVQTGSESYQLVYSAALGADRFSIYSESSVRPQDLRMMSYAASAGAVMQHIPKGWKITAPFPVVLELPKQYTALRTSAGERITSDQGMFFLPAGEHTLEIEQHKGEPFYAAPPMTGRLLSISGELTALDNSSRSVTFSYTSSTRCLASFSHRPYTIFIDGRELDTQPLEGNHRYTILLPRGEHAVIAVLETTVSYGVDITSFWSSWLIVAFGMISGAALLTFYTVVRISRPTPEKT